jgi:hypothetical protein
MGDHLLYTHPLILILFWMRLDNEGVIKGNDDQMPQMWCLLLIQGRGGDI